MARGSGDVRYPDLRKASEAYKKTARRSRMPGEFQGDDTAVAEVETPEEVQTEGQLTHFADTNPKKLLEYLCALQASVND
ncbi:MAG: hypothetical protein M1812_008296, partial [Candelaria pacifica]